MHSQINKMEGTSQSVIFVFTEPLTLEGETCTANVTAVNHSNLEAGV